MDFTFDNEYRGGWNYAADCLSRQYTKEEDPEGETSTWTGEM